MISEYDIEDIAESCHLLNREYCILIGDNSQVAWKDAPEWQKKSAIEGVKYHLENPKSKPSDSHESWSKHKLADGWKHGEVKDAEKKTHPCLVPFDDLPFEQRFKDYLFLSVVRAMERDSKK